MHEGVAILLFVIVSLLLGAAARNLLRNSAFPYTVALLLLGMGLGVIGSSHAMELRMPGLVESVHAISAIDPHMILFLFLPALLFESAFAMDSHTVRRSFGQVLLLAVPGLMLGTVLLAGFGYYALPWSWSWPIALMFGAVMSATDPVAVVAILRELGASKKLATIIEGESLFNDGTAIVAFTVFYAMAISGEAADAASIAGDFVRVALGGFAIGVGIALFVLGWIGRVFNDAMVEITLTIAASYLTFYIAEEMFHVSGVLAIVALGLMFAAYGRTRISSEVVEFLHHFWEMLAYLANSLIFILVGVVVAMRVDPVYVADWWTLALLFVAIHIVRALVNSILSPFLSKWGYGLDWREGVVLTWGGLRGAVGLSLALVVAQDERISGEAGAQLLFLTAGIVVLTLLVNGTTIRALLGWLGMTQVSAERHLLLQGAASSLQAALDQELNVLKDDRFLRGADWQDVRSALPDIPLAAAADMDGGSDRQQELAEGRRRILEAQKASYWKQFHEGQIGARALKILAESIDSTLDDGSELDRTDQLQQMWATPYLLKVAMRLPLRAGRRMSLFVDRLGDNYEIVRGFVNAQEETARGVRSVVSDPGLADQLQGELSRAREAGLRAIQGMNTTFPEVLRAVETRAAKRSLLNYARRNIQKLNEEGLLDQHDASIWTRSVERSIKATALRTGRLELPTPIEMLREVPWLQDLPPETIASIEDLSEERYFDSGADLMVQGAEGDGMCMIARGSIRVLVNVKGQELLVDVMGPGSILGEIAVLTGAPRTATVRADTPVVALWFATDRMQALMDRSPEIETRLWKLTGLRMAENLLGLDSPYRDWGRQELRRWLQGGTVEAPGDQQVLSVDRPTVLLRGQAASPAGDVSVDAPCIIRWSTARVSGGARVFRAPANA